MLSAYPCPLAQAANWTEYALSFDRHRKRRLLIVAPLFEELNRTRSWLADVMRRADLLGLDSFLPDLPGCNESLAPLAEQSITSWRSAVTHAAAHFRPTAILAIRGANLLVGDGLDTQIIRLAPHDGPKILRGLIRARTMASREAGTNETAQTLLAQARKHGIELAGYRMGAAMIGDLETAVCPADGAHQIDPASLGGSPLWLRVEPSNDANQTSKLVDRLNELVR